MLIVVIIILALFYSFLNGANDRANAIATVTATKALTPMKAILLASIFNLAGACISTHVAETIGKGIVSVEALTTTIFLKVIICGLLGAIIWTFICTRLGIPISVTHALIGGLIGAGISAGGIQVIRWNILTNKVFLAIVLGPLWGFIIGALIFAITDWILYLFFKKIPSIKVERIFKWGQIFSASFMSLSHGMNDTQNAMGVVTIALITGGFIPSKNSGAHFSVPLWVMVSCGAAMGIGTFLMGWKVMQTIGWRLTRMEPKHGFSAETGAGIAVTIASLIGMPVSTTHVLGSSVIGGTFFQNLRRIRWSEVKRMVIAWIITIPLTAVIGAFTYWLVHSM